MHTATADAPPGALPRKLQIVPLVGLPFSIALVGLVVYAIATDSFWLLILCHVAGGGLWTAIDLFVGLALGPIIGSPPIRMSLCIIRSPMWLNVLVVTMTLATGLQIALRLGRLDPGAAAHGWLVASMIVVGIMAVVALGVLEPANIAVLWQMRKDQPNPAVIERMMKRFVYTAGITGVMQIATLIIMTKVRTL